MISGGRETRHGGEALSRAVDLGLKDRQRRRDGRGLRSGCALELGREDARLTLFGRRATRSDHTRERSTAATVTRPGMYPAPSSPPWNLLMNIAGRGIDACGVNAGARRPGFFSGHPDPDWLVAAALTLQGYVCAALLFLQFAGGARVVTERALGLRRHWIAWCCQTLFVSVSSLSPRHWRLCGPRWALS